MIVQKNPFENLNDLYGTGAFTVIHESDQPEWVGVVT